MAIVLSLGVAAGIDLAPYGQNRTPAHLDVFLDPAAPGANDPAATIAHLLSTMPDVMSFRFRPAHSNWQPVVRTVDGGVSLLPCFRPGCSSGPSVADLPAVFEVFPTSKGTFGPVAKDLQSQPFVLAVIPLSAGHDR